MNNTHLFKEIVLKDVSDELLEYCVEIPKTGIDCNMHTKFDTELGCGISYFKPGDYGYLLRTYGRTNEEIFTDESFLRFTTFDGRQFLARGKWILPILQEAGYTQANYSNPIFQANGAFTYPNPDIRNKIFSVPAEYPFADLETEQVQAPML